LRRSNSRRFSVTLCPTIRKPFDVLAEGLLSQQSGGGGNRICEGFCDNELHDNELEQSQKSLGATGECVSGSSCQNSSLPDNEFAPSIAFIAQAWPYLAPHIREAIITLIDASLPSREEQGAQL